MTRSDLIFKTLAEIGVAYCCAVSGGGIMYLVDAVGRNTIFKTRFFHHEQAAGFAAEAYGRAQATPAVCLVTIGPGVANAISAAFSCFVNSVPCLFISGAKRSSFQTDYPKQRFNFPQDGDTEHMVSSVVKRYHKVAASEEITQLLPQLIAVACEGRPGPVWLDVPLDIQGMQTEQDLPAASPTRQVPGPDSTTPALRDFLSNVDRPVFLLGRGCEKAFRNEAYRRLLREAALPFITTVGSNHLLKAAGQMNLGYFGPTGRRAANRVLTEADAVIAIGSGVDIDTTGFDRASFFRGKRIVTVNTDPWLEIAEASDWTKITASVHSIDFAGLAGWLAGQKRFANWADFCRGVGALLSAEQEIRLNLTANGVDPYLFCRRLSQIAPGKAGFAGGISLDIVAFSHVAELHDDQEFYLSPHAGQLGWDLPAAVGLADTGRFDTIVCLTGDGSMMFNLQELATLRSLDNIAIIFFDNDGYNSIRTSQDTHLGGRRFGSDLHSLTFPDWQALSQAFGCHYLEIHDNAEIDRVEAAMTGRWLVRVKVDPDRGRTPRLVSQIKDGKFVSPTIFHQFPDLPPAIEAAYAALRAHL